MAVFSHFPISSLFQPLTATAILLSAFFLAPVDALAQFGNENPQTFIAPGKLFKVNLPSGWSVFLPKDDPYTFEFRPQNSGIHTSLFIRRVSVPRQANPRQLMLNALEKRLKKLPGLKILRKSDNPIASYPAATLTAHYLYQGNIQYPKFLEESYVVTQREAFVFHFETFESNAGNLAHDLEAIYSSFQPRPRRGTPTKKLKPATRKGLIDLDNIAY